MKTAKKNGQAVPGKTFQIGGTIKVAGPEFRGNCEQRIEENGVELNIAIEQANEGKVIELEPWISMIDADVKISSLDMGSPEDDVLDISFKSAGGRSFVIAINSAQAKALSEISTNFVHACDSWAALKKVYPVSAAV